MKVKGLSLKYAHRNMMNLQVMEDMVKQYCRDGVYRQDTPEGQLTVDIPQFSLLYNKKDQTTYTHYSLKKAKFVADQLKGLLGPDGKVYPIGFCVACIWNDAEVAHTCLNLSL
jgi:hypothetical protein